MVWELLHTQLLMLLLKSSTIDLMFPSPLHRVICITQSSLMLGCCSFSFEFRSQNIRQMDHCAWLFLPAFPFLLSSSNSTFPARLHGPKITRLNNLLDYLWLFDHVFAMATGRKIYAFFIIYDMVLCP